MATGIKLEEQKEDLVDLRLMHHDCYQQIHSTRVPWG